MEQIILNFHGIGQCPEHLLEEEGNHWIDEEKFEETCKLSQNSGKNILFTFDDGNKSDIEIAAPLLRQFHLQGIFFVLTNRINKTGYLSEEDILQIKKEGFSIGLHGHDHIPWKEIESLNLTETLKKAKSELEGITKSPVSSVAIPFGAYNKKVLKVLKEIDFKRVFTSDPGISKTDNWFNNRITIKADTDLSEAFSSLHAGNPKFVFQSIKTLIKRNI